MSGKGKASNAAMVSRTDLRAQGQPLSSLEYQYADCIFRRPLFWPSVSKQEKSSCG
jgi:hypothetical protein